MALDRQTIEKKDFPIGRRGYDPDAVDAHLESLTREVESLKRSNKRRTETLASAASEQVRAIVEAAESSAAEIERQAEEEAREIREDASTEADRLRSQAGEQAREYVGKVSESTSVMLQRIEAMDTELDALVESLRTGTNRLNADLALLEGNMSEVQEATGERQRFEAVEPAPLRRRAAPRVAVEEPDDFEEELEDAEDASAPRHAAAPANGDESDSEGARLIALNMALNGTPRDETDRYLAENFDLADRSTLLDEVYASVEG
ncbi:MAG: DivIVA domain-containing protein [Solirubrobacteraceae bacterium]